MAQTNKKQWSAGGFLFTNEKECMDAEKEIKKIEYLEAKMNYSKANQVSKVYENLIKERVFRTQPGILYLKSLQDFLMSAEEIEKESVSPIPIFTIEAVELREKSLAVKETIKKPAAKKENKSSALPLSIILNILLLIAIVSMFGITLKSDQPNIFNYKEAIVNQYASWEQELTQREQAVREKEQSLNME